MFFVNSKKVWNLYNFDLKAKICGVKMEARNAREYHK